MKISERSRYLRDQDILEIKITERSRYKISERSRYLRDQDILEFKIIIITVNNG